MQNGQCRQSVAVPARKSSSCFSNRLTCSFNSGFIFLSGVSSEKGKVKYLSVFFACSLFAISRNAALPSGQSEASDSRNVVRMLALLTAVAPSFQWLLHYHLASLPHDDGALARLQQVLWRFQEALGRLQEVVEWL